MHTHIREIIRRHKIFRAGDTVVVAVSGGADSVALLHLLRSLEECPLSLVVAHFNHLLRGEESDGDEAFVAALAEMHGLPYAVRRFDVKEFAGAQGLSLEEAGRVCRYRFFSDVAEQHGAATVALAHHADDQAETVLMRLLRGSGATGLCGMTAKTGDGRYVRPLLEVSRIQIEAYLAEHGLAYRTDSSNNDKSFLRNRIRHELIPYLETYNPAVRERLAATADALAADEAVLESLAGNLFENVADVQPDHVKLSVEKVRREAQGVRLRLYRRALLLVKGDLRRIGRRHLDAIDGVVHDQKPHLTLAMPDGVTIGKSYGDLWVSAVKESFEVPEACIIAGPGAFLWAGCRVTVSTGATGDREAAGAWRACFDGDAAPFPWVIRSFRKGDRFVPFGMAGHKKVKDYFIDQKVPRDKRCLIPLLFCGDTLLWVAGLRRSAAAPVTIDTGLVITADLELLQP